MKKQIVKRRESFRSLLECLLKSSQKRKRGRETKRRNSRNLLKLLLVSGKGKGRKEDKATALDEVVVDEDKIMLPCYH